LELDLYISGIGGQGIQLASKVLGTAAMAEYEVMLTSEFGGEMRGGPSRSAVVITDGEMRALPVLASAGSAIAMHHLEWAKTADRLRKGSLVLIDSEVGKDVATDASWNVVHVPASKIATDAGNIMSACMAIVSTYAALNRLLNADALVEGMKTLVPAYRRQHLEVNERAIRAGYLWGEEHLAPGMVGANRKAAS
jgi:2-oxoglutarate ferredoxin oxidoreductase subunit gamma